MPTSTSNAPTRPGHGREATPGRNCAADWKPDTRRARPRSTRPPSTTTAQRAPPTPPAAAPCNAGTPNAAGSAARPDARAAGEHRPPVLGRLDQLGQDEVVVVLEAGDDL